MRVVSLVPSWTETLVEAGVDVVGRTRFCIHPANAVADIPAVGGTKKVDWEKIRNLRPDLVVLDREENPKEFIANCPCPWWASHVIDLSSLRDALHELSQVLQCQQLDEWSTQLQTELSLGPHQPTLRPQAALRALAPPNPDQPWIYMIWRKPWMIVEPRTFIGQVLTHMGFPIIGIQPPTTQYPEVSEEFVRANNCLFSSEPYPFLDSSEQLVTENFRGWIVDGECYSWFGVRTLRFLQKVRSAGGDLIS